LISRALGCIFGELILNRPLLPGRTELDQLELIYDLLGAPNARLAPVREWKNFEEMNEKLFKEEYK